MAVRNGTADEALGGLYPFEDKYVELPDGRLMHYIEAGQGGMRRPTFLLLHGNPTWSFLYRRFVEPLSHVGRVVAPDHIGFGRSDHPADPEYHTLERHIENLTAFVERLDLKRVIPVVQDWGGPIGLGWAARNRERLRALVILNTWAFTDARPKRLPAWFRMMRSKRVGQYLFGSHNLFVEQFIPRFTHTELSDDVMEGYRHPFNSRAGRQAIVAFPRMIPDRPGHPEWATLTAVQDALPKLDVPALILFAKDDPVFRPADAAMFHRLLPHAEAPRYFDGAGHYLQEDVPHGIIGEIIDFVRRL